MVSPTSASLRETAAAHAPRTPAELPVALEGPSGWVAEEPPPESPGVEAHLGVEQRRRPVRSELLDRDARAGLRVESGGDQEQHEAE